MRLLPGDIVFFHGHSIISRAIRFMTRTIGESRTKVNHVGVIGPPKDGHPMIVEALTTVQYHPFQEDIRPNVSIAVYRPLNLLPGERTVMDHRAMHYVGKKYGYLKLLLHALDWCLLGAYVFRRLGRMDNYPICSYVVASVYKEIGHDFGVPFNAASPDDIWDYVTSHPLQFRKVWQHGEL